MCKLIKVKLSGAAAAGRSMAQILRGGEILALTGPLGAGKTTFTQALGRALGVRRRIASPTFILLQKFSARLPEKTKAGSKTRAKPPKRITLYHLDLYRTHGWREVETLGLTELWGKPDTVTVIEWANKIRSKLPACTSYIYFSYDKN